MASGGRGSGSPASWSRSDDVPDEVLDDDRPARGLPPWAGRAVVAVAVLALAAYLVPRLLSSDHPTTPRPTSAATPTATVPIPSVSPTLPGSLRWATRGDLRDDRALLDSVRARVTGNELTSVQEVLWAGRVAAGRAVVVAGFDQRTGVDPAYSVPVFGVLLPADGGTPTTHQVGDMSGGPDNVLSWALPKGQVLLLGPPTRLEAQVSTDVTFTRDGQANRDWVDAVSDEGWKLVAVPSRPHASIAVRTDLGINTLSTDPEVDVTELPVAGIGAPGYHGPVATVVRETLSPELARPPLAGWPVTARVVWSGNIGEGGIGQAVVVVLRRSDGVTFRAGMIGGLDEGPAAFGLRTVRWSHPEQVPYVFESVGGSLGLDGRQVVAVPGGRGTLSYVTGNGRGTVPVDAHGVAIVDAGVFDVDPVSVTVTNSLGTRHYDRRSLLGDDPQGAGFEDRIGGPG